MSYPQQVPPGWTRGEAVFTIGTGPRYAIGRDIGLEVGQSAIDKDEFLIEFDSHADATAWLKWWKSPDLGRDQHGT